MSTRTAILKATFVVVSGAALCACATHPSDTKGFREAELSSPSYQIGYNDGCEGANQNYAQAKTAGGRNDQLFQSDPTYREGWLAGRTNCLDTTFLISNGKPADHLESLF
jgi:hypothetical protein